MHLKLSADGSNASGVKAAVGAVKAAPDMGDYRCLRPRASASSRPAATAVSNGVASAESGQVRMMLLELQAVRVRPARR